jgi:hypothetical protein
MFPLLAGWSEFAVTPMEVTLDGLRYGSSSQRVCAKQITKENI